MRFNWLSAGKPFPHFFKGGPFGHISQLAKTRVNKTTDVVKEGDRVKVKVMGYDDRGKVKLSMRVVDQQTGADLEKTPAAEPAVTAE